MFSRRLFTALLALSTALLWSADPIQKDPAQLADSTSLTATDSVSSSVSPLDHPQLSRQPLPEGVALRLELDPAEVSIGDRITARLTLEYPAQMRAEMPHGVAQLGSFEVITFSEEEPTKLRKGWMKSEWSYQLALFGTGHFLLPPLLTLLSDSSTQIVWPLFTDPALVSVVSRGLDSTADIAADLPPLPLSSPIAPKIIGALLLIALLAAVVFLLFKKRWRTLFEPPHQRALKEIDQLLAKGDGTAEEQARHNLFCLHLGLTMRGYLDRRFGLETLEKTSSELLQTLQQKKGEWSEWYEMIEEFSRRTDMVKFAGVRLNEGEAETLAAEVRRMVIATAPREEETKKRTPKFRSKKGGKA